MGEKQQAEIGEACLIFALWHHRLPTESEIRELEAQITYDKTTRTDWNA